MNNIDLLILQGPPAAGKSSIAKSIAGQLHAYDVRHAVIELDDLARIHPFSLKNIMYKNLAAIWPNYEALGEIKVIMPTYMQAGERELIVNAAPARQTRICEVEVPHSEAARRIKSREIGEPTKQMHLNYLVSYDDNKTSDSYIDFRVKNFNRSASEAAKEIIRRLEWQNSLTKNAKSK